MDIINGKIRVYNYESSPVGFPSERKKHGNFIKGTEEDEEFVVERIAWEDIETENSKSDLIKNGRVRFNPLEEDEIYKKLGIDDRENIMNDNKLMEMLKNDSADNLKKINKIKSNILLGRMKRMLFKMERNNTIPSPKIITVINERYDEIKNGKRSNENKFINKIIEAEKKQKKESQLKDTLDKLMIEVNNLKKENVEKAKTQEETQNALADMLKEVQKLKKENSKLKKEKSKSEKSSKLNK